MKCLLCEGWILNRRDIYCAKHKETDIGQYIFDYFEHLELLRLATLKLWAEAMEQKK